MDDLGAAERLIVWSFRRWVLGLRENRGAHWSMVWSEFARQFGARAGKEALSGFAALMKGIQCHVRRTLHYHQPCCPCVGDDEVSILRFVAACQSDQLLRARSMAEWLVAPEGVGDLLQGGTRLARTMRQHALVLPQRAGCDILDSSDARPETERATLH